MPQIDLALNCVLQDSFRIQQVAGMLGLDPQRAAEQRLSVEVPGLDEDWKIGAIVGPSGSGKSSMARAAFGAGAFAAADWDSHLAIIDQLGDHPIEEISRVLTAVGLGHAACWLRPFAQLSCGEQHRAALARALLQSRSYVVCDDFASFVDFSAARGASLAISRLLRHGAFPTRFVAVTCHEHVTEWLAPDWIVDMGEASLRWRSMTTPCESTLLDVTLPLTFARCSASHWAKFAKYHYLSGALSCAATCYAAFHQRRPIAFCGVLSEFGRPRIHRVTRLVTLPDYQGLGIGVRLLGHVAKQERDASFRVRITTSHPAMVHSLEKNPDWQSSGKRLVLGRHRVIGNCPLASSQGRFTASFEYFPRASSEVSRFPNPEGGRERCPAKT